jgi:hypothetical protein
VLADTRGGSGHPWHSVGNHEASRERDHPKLGIVDLGEQSARRVLTACKDLPRRVARRDHDPAPQRVVVELRHCLGFEEAAESRSDFAELVERQVVVVVGVPIALEQRRRGGALLIHPRDEALETRDARSAAS